MKFARAVCLMALTLTIALPVMADCVYPKKPDDPPSGATATLEQMKAAKGVTTKYAEDMKAYLTCLDDDANAQIAALGQSAKPEVLEQIKNKRDLKYSAAEEIMLKYADGFNAEIRAYKAKQAQPAK